MRFTKILAILTVVLLAGTSGCNSGGGDGGSNGTGTSNVSGNGGGTATTPSGVTASVRTVLGAQAVCILSVNNVSSNICGFDANLSFPSGATYYSAASSGVAYGSLVSANPVGNTLKIALASGTGFSSGEVATITFDLASAVNASNFAVTSFTPHSCP
jgi:hypothetical protein